MTATSSTQLDTEQPAQLQPNIAWVVVVGCDGSDPSRAALEVATELIRGRDGHLEVVYDGSGADELIAAARDLRPRNGSESIVVIVVGSARHLFHHAIGTAATLTRAHEFPLLVVPLIAGARGPATQADGTTGESQPSQPASDHDLLVDRNNAEQVLSRAGFSKNEIADVLGSVTFPAPQSAVVLRGQQFGISAGSLMERLGSSP